MKKNLLITVFVFVTLFAFANTKLVLAVGEPAYISTFGSNGVADGQFEYMRGMTSDSAGNIYIVDEDLHKVQKFNNSGGYLSRIGSLGSGDGEFQEPKGVAVDASGNVYVADSLLDRVQKFNSAGDYVRQWGTSGSANGQFSFARDIAVDASGNVYVVDANNYRIQKFDSDGNFITKWGTEGSTDGKFNSPAGIAVNYEGYVYVVDSTNNNIQKFSPTGGFISKFGTTGSGNGEFTFAYGIAIDDLGEIFVTDIYDSSMQKFSAAGTFIAKLDSTANGGHFTPVGGIATTLNGNLYIANGTEVLIYDGYNTTLSSWFNDPPFVVSTSSVSFNWFTSHVASSSIWYGPSPSIVSNTATSSGVRHSATITGLTPATIYSFEARSIDSNGGSDIGEADSFTTHTVPVITLATTSSVTSTTATVTWTTNILTSSKVVYSIDNSYGLTTTETDTSPRVTSHSVSLSSLVPCTTYTMKAVSKSSQLEIATSTGQSFTTTGCVGNVVPSIATSTNVSSNAVATTTLTDTVSSTTIEVITPSGFTSTSSEVVIQIRALNSDTTLVTTGIPSVSGLQSIGDTVFDVKALVNNQTILDSFDIPVTITYTYSDADVAGFVESTIQMYHYHNGVWLALSDCVVNTTANTITCTAPSFSIFGLFGTLTSSLNSSSGSGSSNGATAVSGISVVPAWLFANNTSGAQAGTQTGGQNGAQAGVLAQNATSTFVFTRNLSLNNTHAEVKNLQRFLNTHGFIVATTGAGSLGKETTKFGPATRAALIRFQKANKISPAIGFFGPITRAVIAGMK